MTDFETLRRRMVDNQIRPAGVTDYAVIEAFLAVPREMFVTLAERPFAYADRELSMLAAAPERSMMPPVPLARMIQLLAVDPTSKVMVVGCGTGYSAAILARLARRVVAVEEDSRLAAAARENLEHVHDSAMVARAPLTDGCPAEAPYDAVLVDGAIETDPDNSLEQLKPGAFLVAVKREARVSRAVLYERVGGDAAKWPQFDAWAALLPGFAKAREFEF